jgi:hypothetical protein
VSNITWGFTGKLLVKRYLQEGNMQVAGRKSTRHMKGKQVAMTLYLSPKRYWLLKWLSNRKGLSMQAILRQAIDELLEDAASLR